MRGSKWVGAGMRGCAWVCVSMHGHAWVYAGVCKCVLVYTDMRRCTGVCNGVHVCMWDDFSDKVPYTNHVDHFLDFFDPLPPSTAIPSLY